MARAIGYVRVSTDEQAASGLGLEAQRESIRRWCEQQGHELERVYSDEGISGAADIDKRPGLMAAIGALQAGSVLVVACRDRLARDLYVATGAQRLVEQAWCQVEQADGSGNGNSPEAQLQRALSDAFAQYERAKISLRTRAAYRAKIARGETWGRTVTQPSESVEMVRKLQADGYSLRGIADAMTELQMPRVGGAAWTIGAVRRVLAK